MLETKEVFSSYRQIWFIRKHQDNCHDFHFKRKPRNLGTSVKLSVAILACCLELNICLMNFPFPIRNRKQCYKWNVLRCVSDAYNSKTERCCTCYVTVNRLQWGIGVPDWNSNSRFLSFKYFLMWRYVPSCWQSPSSGQLYFRVSVMYPVSGRSGHLDTFSFSSWDEVEDEQLTPVLLSAIGQQAPWALLIICWIFLSITLPLLSQKRKKNCCQLWLLLGLLKCFFSHDIMQDLFHAWKILAIVNNNELFKQLLCWISCSVATFCFVSNSCLVCGNRG